LTEKYNNYVNNSFATHLPWHRPCVASLRNIS
jgi:hypothetical protein